MAQNQRFSDARYRPIASAMPRGRVPAIAVAPRATAWARRTRSTNAKYQVARREDQWSQRNAEGAPPPFFGGARRTIIAAARLNRNRKGRRARRGAYLAAAACGFDAAARGNNRSSTRPQMTCPAVIWIC